VSHLELRCVVPPSPELFETIVRSKQKLLAHEVLPEEAQVDVLDLRSLTLILGRPVKTRAHTFIAAPRALAPVVGTVKALVLLVDFSDKAATETNQHYVDMLFTSGTYATGSLRDFYWEASYNKLTVTGAVSGQGGPTAGWYRAPQPYSYYTNGNYGFGAYPQNAQKLVEDVVDLADPFVNFADYDNDGDGFVDALFIVHAGPGAEATGNVNDIWSHQWGITPKTVDGVKVSTYSMEPEDGRIGVFCHELGHVFGLPDLYDTDYSSAGTGRWDLMAGGSWNNGGLTPAHPVAWCKVKLGWVTPVTLFNVQQSVTIQPSETHAEIYKLPVGSAASSEYFLLENRQQTGFDSNLPGEGLLVAQIDDNQTNNTDENHYLVDVEQCDGNFDLNKNANQGDATDPFPCGANAQFTANTTPNSKAYDGSDSQISVTNIQRSGANITADINVGGVAAVGWLYSRQIMMTFAHHTSQWAWAYVSGLGWRRIKDGAPDGVTNVFIACCEALTNNRTVHVYVDGTFIYTMYVV
jgi:immune inhibitor A